MTVLTRGRVENLPVGAGDRFLDLPADILDAFPGLASVFADLFLVDGEDNARLFAGPIGVELEPAEVVTQPATPATRTMRTKSGRMMSPFLSGIRKKGANDVPN